MTPKPVIIIVLRYSSLVGLRAILITRPYLPLPRPLNRSSIFFWTLPGLVDDVHFYAFLNAALIDSL